ncbi:nucleotidyltransferase domain-containing protein [Candidatus Woesearchaeota archaeon]|nr:nucleotidyltransferase domain-containing protein [Candidatus Woesearchaeota archaeon]
MDTKKDLIKKLKIFRESASKQVPINKMLFFGSYAKGKPHKWSDIDLIVVSSKFEKRKSFKRARKLYDYWDLDYPVDFLCYTPKEFNRLKKQFTAVREATKNGIEI